MVLVQAMREFSCGLFDSFVHVPFILSRSMCAGPFPFESSLSADSIQFGISTSRQFDGTSIKQPTQTDWSVGFVEHSGNMQDHKALSWVNKILPLDLWVISS